MVGFVPASTVLHLAIGLPLPDPQGLDTFIQQVSDPHGPSYRNYLTPDLFAAQFGPLPFDYQNVVTWAQSNGLTIDVTYPNNLLLE